MPQLSIKNSSSWQKAMVYCLVSALLIITNSSCSSTPSSLSSSYRTSNIEEKVYNLDTQIIELQEENKKLLDKVELNSQKINAIQSYLSKTGVNTSGQTQKRHSSAVDTPTDEYSGVELPSTGQESYRKTKDSVKDKPTDDQKTNKLEQALQIFKPMINKIKPEKKKSDKGNLVKSKELYKKALNTYYNKDYQKARELFNTFLQKFPDTDLSDNAQYWRGESYLAEGKYQQAIDEFKKVLNNYPQGNKTPDSIYMIGLCYHKQGKLNLAVNYYDQVISSYPNNKVKEFASNKRDQIMR